MNNQMRIIAEMAARLLLQQFQEEHSDWDDDRTPVDALVSWLGLHSATFHPDDYPEGTYGFIDPDEGEDLIWLRRDLQENLRRFTLAHELGHAVLHCQGGGRLTALSSAFADLAGEQVLPELSRSDPCYDADVQENLSLLDEQQFQEVLGVGQSYDPRSQRELAANIFAAELLMPLERMRALYLVQRVPAHTLASAFGVSNSALLYRLAGLLKGSHSPAEVPEAFPVPVQEPRLAAPKKQYDEFQQAAIEASTPALIVAGPGSGKTSTLIGRVEYTICALGIPPQSILALTFSRKAANEMEERLQQALAASSDSLSLPKVSTFHAFCADLLRQHGALVGLRQDFTLIDEAEGYFLLRQLGNRMRLRHYQKLQSPTYHFPDFLKAISRAKDELVSPEDYAALAQRMRDQADNDEDQEAAEKALEVAEVYSLYQTALSRRGDADFGGLLMLTLQLFREHPAILREQQQKYQQILVDEFQDVNRASGVLLRELAGEQRQVWVVGDANQAIYGFRGASPANIGNFTTDFPGAVVLPLSRNYRSRPDLVTLAESFRCQHLEVGQEQGKNQPARLTHPDTYVTLAKAADETSELEGIIQDIRYKNTHGYTYKDMIVLCRTRSHAQKISRALSTAGLPTTEQGGMLEQEYIKDALSMLLLLTDASGMGLLRAARQQDHPLSQDDIEALLLSALKQKVSPRTLLFSGEVPWNMSEHGRQALARLSQILQNLQHAPDTWSLLAQYLFIETSLIRDLLSEPENKQHLTILADYDRLLQFARHYDQQRVHLLRMEVLVQESAEPGVPSSLSLDVSVKGFLEYLCLLVLLRQDGNSRQSASDADEASADIIRVMTVHASKGLEFPVVYMPGLVQHRFPLQARSSPVSPPDGMLLPESTGSAAHESGESCLFYVGMTRARDHLVLSYSERYGKKKYKRSPYLDALEAGLVGERLTQLRWEFQSNVASTVGTAIVADDQPLATSSQPTQAFVQAMHPSELSASTIEAYQRCPRQYAYSAIYHFSGETDGYQLFWQATQKTVEQLRQRMQAGGDDSKSQPLPGQKEIQELYTRHWQELGGHVAPFAPMYEEHGHEIVEAIRRQLMTQQEVSWDMRPGYNIDIAGKAIRVTVDRVEASHQSGEPMKFVRTRFGKRKTKPAAEMRDLFYTLVYRQLHPGQSVELHSHNLSTGEVVPITMTAKKEQSLYDSVERVIKGLENNDYPAQPAEPFRCPSCPFFLICPA